MSTSTKNFFPSKNNSYANVKTSPEQSKSILATSTSLSSARNFLKFNESLLKKKPPQEDDKFQNKQNGFMRTANDREEHSPLISRKYPHYRICKSSSESSSSSSLKTSPKINSKITSVVKLQSMNETKDSFQYSNVQSKKRQTFVTEKQKRPSDWKQLIHTPQNDVGHVFQSLRNREDGFANCNYQFDRDNFQRNSFNAADSRPMIGSNNSINIMNETDSISNDQYGKILLDSSKKINVNLEINDEKECSSKNDSIEWIEIMEPKSGTKMFANLRTNECRWIEPKGVSILRQSNPNITQWWQLYDQKSQRYYYYSVKSCKTIWQKPTSPDAIIVPLAKLQIIKNENRQPHISEQFEDFSLSSLSASSNVSTAQQSTNTSRCLACKCRNKIMVDCATQTNYSQLVEKRSMISRWTQTTSQKPINICLGRSREEKEPSLQHYLLSEARFAARGQTHVLNNLENIYDPIAESIYDPVTNENYYHIYDDDDEFINNEDEEFDYDLEDNASDFSCDADDEYGENSYSDDDNDGDGDDEEEDEEEGEEELEDDEEEWEHSDQDDKEAVRSGDFCPTKNELNRTKLYTDYDDYIRLASNQPTSKLLASKEKRINIGAVSNSYDGLRMSASFTASDFKRNALGRSSYTPSMHQHYPSYSQHEQKESPAIKTKIKDAYSNPFNKNDSLRSSTGQGIKLNGIANRIQLFNEKFLNEKDCTKPTLSPPKTLNVSTESPSCSLIRCLADAGQIKQSIDLEKKAFFAKTQQSKSTSLNLISPKSTSPPIIASDNKSTNCSNLNEKELNRISLTNNEQIQFSAQFNDAHKMVSNKLTSDLKELSVKNNHTNKDCSISNKKTKSKCKSKCKSMATGNLKSSSNNNNSIESFARECVSRHRKGGIFSKKKTLKSMLSYTKKALKKPMISTISDSLLVKESVTCFKMIQIFMGDRTASPITSLHANSSNEVPIRNNTDEYLLLQLINICVTLVPLRDEVLVQVARQVTQNPSADSELRGLELMCTLFWYFTASNKLAQHLHAFLMAHSNPFTSIVRRKFEQQMHRSRYTHSHLFYRKPHSVEEVGRVLRCVRAKHVGIFGETLADSAWLHKDSDNSNSIINVPWPVFLLSEAITEPRHEDREGVFRCVGDMDDVHKLKMKLDTIIPKSKYFEQLFGSNLDKKEVKKLTNDHDIHVIASTLKLYFRELREPLIPNELYMEALEAAHDAQKACQLLDRLSDLNRATLIYLIHFLQIFSTSQNVRDTKMDDANLSMVWAPNILRNTLTNQITGNGNGGKGINIMDSANIYEHTRAEMSFVRTLIQYLPTSNRN